MARWHIFASFVGIGTPCRGSRGDWAPREDLQQLDHCCLAALGVRLCARFSTSRRERGPLSLPALLDQAVDQLLCAGLRLESRQTDQRWLSRLAGRHIAESTLARLGCALLAQYISGRDLVHFSSPCREAEALVQST